VLGVSERQLYGSKGKKAYILRDEVKNGTEDSYKEAMEKYYRDEGKDEAYIKKYLYNKPNRNKRGTITSWTVSRDIKKYRMRKAFGFEDRNVNKMLKGTREKKLERLHLTRQKMNDDEFDKYITDLLNPQYGRIINKQFMIDFWAKYPDDKPMKWR
jgi:hypothetical protein